jgi:hypothetical protein
VTQGRERDLARVQELEGKPLYSSVVGFFEIRLLPLAMIRAKGQACHGGGGAFVGVGGSDDGATQAF